MARSAGNKPVGGKRILIVDDDPLVVITLELLLSSEGHEVIAVDHPEAALASLEDSRFDLVITDLGLPQMDGLALAGVIKRRFPGQPVVLSSGSPELMRRDLENSPSIDFLLLKPFTLEHLRDALDKIMPGPAPGLDQGRTALPPL